VDKLATSLYQHPGLQNLTLLVRPHPQNLNHWEQYQPKNSNTIIWQKDLFVMGTSNVRQDFYHSLYYSTGVVGINTSAFIETAIVDKPCIAIASDQYELTQMGIPHFKHLLDAGFLELPHDFGEAVSIIAGIVKGEDRKKDQRREFIRYFIRPHGIDCPAAEVMSQAILNVAGGNPPYLKI